MLGSLGACGKPPAPSQSAPAATVSPVATSTPVTSAAMDVTLTAMVRGDQERAEQYAASSNGVGLATVLLLESSAGAIRFVDDPHAPVSVAKATDGGYQLRLSYTPENNRDLAGHTVEELSASPAVDVRYGGVLNALGLDPTTARVTRITMRLNGATTTGASLNASIGDTGADFGRVPLR